MPSPAPPTARWSASRTARTPRCIRPLCCRSRCFRLEFRGLCTNLCPFGWSSALRRISEICQNQLFLECCRNRSVNWQVSGPCGYTLNINTSTLAVDVGHSVDQFPKPLQSRLLWYFLIDSHAQVLPLAQFYKNEEHFIVLVLLVSPVFYDIFVLQFLHYL